MAVFAHQDRQADAPPLWQPGSIQADDAARDLARRSYAAQRSLMGYYFTEHWDYWAWMLVLALGFFAWVFSSFRKLRQHAAGPAVAGVAAGLPATPLALPANQRLHYLRPVPVSAALLVVFSLAPFFDLQPPAAYTDLLQLLLLATLTWLGWRSWPRRLFWFWLGVVGLFFALAFVYANRAPGLAARWLLLLLHVGAAGVGWQFWRYLRQTRLLATFVRPVALLYVGLNVLAALAGAAGRVSLAKVLSTTAGVALTQAVALSAFVRVVTEAFFLQAQRARLAGGLGTRFSFGKMESGLRKVLTGVVGVLWLMLVSTNLNLYNLLFRLLDHAVTNPHRLGTTTFYPGWRAALRRHYLRHGAAPALHRLRVWGGRRRLQRRYRPQGVVAGAHAAGHYWGWGAAGHAGLGAAGR